MYQRVILLILLCVAATYTFNLNVTEENIKSNYEDIKYKYFIDKEIEANGYKVQLDFTSTKSLWKTLHQKYQPFYIMIGFYSFMTISYWLVSIVFIAIEQLRLFDSYKIHKGVYNSWGTYARCFANLLFNYIIIILPNLLPGWIIFNYLGMSWDEQSFPDVFTFVWQQAFCFVGEDFFQYFFHRLLHIPFFYKNVHKLHHEFQSPFALTASYSHPVELVFLGMCTFAPAIILRLHLFTFYCWIWIRQMDATIEHCGYDIPNPLHILPYYGGIDFHDYHHTGFTTNYASRFTYLDKLFGTYKKPPETYGEQEKKIK